MPIIFFVIAILTRNQRRKVPVVTAPSVMPATHLSTDAQWTKLAGIVSTSIDRMAVTQRYHAAAEDQLDAAAYALSNLLEELAAVMVLPARHPGMAVVRIKPAPHVITARRTVAVAA